LYSLSGKCYLARIALQDRKRILKLSFEKSEQYLKITIEDNGIGIEESKKQKTRHQKTREGRGMKNTLERIQLLNDLYKKYYLLCKR
jgi:sensor histidine kinase YesM